MLIIGIITIACAICAIIALVVDAYIFVFKDKH
jgi:hypothetical protein